MKNLSRRSFLKIVSALAVSGALAWKPDKATVEAEEDASVIAVDPAETGSIDQPFYPYFVEDRASIVLHWDDMEDGDTWGLPNE